MEDDGRVGRLMMIQTDGPRKRSSFASADVPTRRATRRDECASERTSERANPPLVVVSSSSSSVRVVVVIIRSKPTFGGAVRISPLSTYPCMCIQYYLHVIPIPTYFY